MPCFDNCTIFIFFLILIFIDENLKSKHQTKETTKKPNKKNTAKKSKASSGNSLRLSVETLSASEIEEKQKQHSLNNTDETKLFRVPSVSRRSDIYESCAKLLASKESQAFPSHGGRTWSCYIIISDNSGSLGHSSDLRPSALNKSSKVEKKTSIKRQKSSNSKGLPLFRWYRNALELACLPHLLDEIDPVEGSYLDFLKDVSSGNEVDEEDEILIKNSVDVSREITTYSKVAYKEYPTPVIDRVWISPDLLSFRTRKKAVEHALMLFSRDKLMDRVLYGYGDRGVELEPAKPSQEEALEAGMARFLRDGLWVVGQEEAWLPDRVFEWNTGKRLVAHQVLDHGDKVIRNSICTDAKGPEQAEKLENSSNRKIYEFTASKHSRLTEFQSELCYNAALQHFDRVMYTVKARGLYSELDDGFDLLRERGRGRFDMELPIFDTPEFDFMTNLETAAWMPIVNKIFNHQPVSLVHKGIFISMPDSAAQVYHQDGVHLTTKYQKACHAINVFIPLVDLHPRNGPTEFCVGTHYLGYENYSKDLVEMPLVSTGTPIIFDYRLGHRGMANSSNECRPVLYLTYTTVENEFRDSVNFSRKRYHKIGRLLDPPLSREERALKRRNSNLSA